MQQVQRIPEACFVTLLLQEEPVWLLPPCSAKTCEDLAEDGPVHGRLLTGKPCISLVISFMRSSRVSTDRYSSCTGSELSASQKIVLQLPWRQSQLTRDFAFPYRVSSISLTTCSFASRAFPRCFSPTLLSLYTQPVSVCYSWCCLRHNSRTPYISCIMIRLCSWCESDRQPCSGAQRATLATGAM